MAVLVEGISVIVKANRLLDVFVGDYERFTAVVPNKTLCSDGELVRVGFMAPDDVRAFVEELAELGLQYVANDTAQDLTVCDQLSGFMAKTLWAEYGHIDLASDGSRRIAACRLVGSEVQQVATPEDWEWESSLTHSFLFASGDQAGQTLQRIHDEGDIEVWKSPLSEQPYFLGRTTKRRD